MGDELLSDSVEKGYLGGFVDGLDQVGDLFEDAVGALKKVSRFVEGREVCANFDTRLLFKLNSLYIRDHGLKSLWMDSLCRESEGSFLRVDGEVGVEEYKVQS